MTGEAYLYSSFFGIPITSFCTFKCPSEVILIPRSRYKSHPSVILFHHQGSIIVFLHMRTSYGFFRMGGLARCMFSIYMINSLSDIVFRALMVEYGAFRIFGRRGRLFPVGQLWCFAMATRCIRWIYGRLSCIRQGVGRKVVVRYDYC